MSNNQFEKLALLGQAFATKLPDRLAGLDVLAEQLREGHSGAGEELRRDAHRLVGAAGQFRFHEISNAARKVEDLAAGFDAADPNALLRLDAAMDVLAQAVAHPIQGSGAAVTVVRPKGNLTIMVVCDDPDQAEWQASVLGQAGYRVAVQPSLDLFVQACFTQPAPDALIIGLSFEEGESAGANLVKTVGHLLAKTAVIVLTSRNDMPSRLRAMRAGAHRYITKPVDRDALLHIVAEATRPVDAAAARVLIIDPDLDALRQLSRSLREQGLQTLTQVNPLQVLADLDQFNPEVLLMELNPPGCSAMEMIKVLREHYRYRDLPVIVHAASATLEERLGLMERGGTFFVPKPADPVELASIVQIHARQYRKTRAHWELLTESQYERARQLEAMNAHAIIRIANGAGETVYVNDHYVEVSQLERRDVLGQDFLHFPPAVETPEAARAALESDLKAGSIWQGQRALTRPDGSVYWLESSVVPFLGTDGKPYRYISVSTDITQIKETELALMEARVNERSTAARIQSTLLLGTLFDGPAGATVSGRALPAIGAAGDFYELFPLGDTCFDVMIGDVMGKGISAALIGAAVKMEFHKVHASLLLATPGVLPSPEALVNAAHRSLTPHLIELGSFVTMNYVRCDLAANRLTSVSAGHPESLLMSDAGVERIPSLHVPLGVLDDEVYAQTVHTLNGGETLFMYSDGLTEAPGLDGEQFGEERLTQAVHHAHQRQFPAGIVGEAVIDQVSRHAAPDASLDDMTVVTLTIPRTGEVSWNAELPRSLDSLTPLRAFLRDRCGSLGIDDAVVDSLELVGAEAATNIIRHARTQVPDSRISVTLSVTASHLGLALNYLGQPFQPPVDPPEPELTLDREGGFGLFLMHQICASVTYLSDKGVNSTVLQLHRQPQ
jgi:PAS domain S-box-containing protein